MNGVTRLAPGRQPDGIGRRCRLIAVAWGLYALTYAGFAMAGGSVVVLPLGLLYGACYGVNEAVGRALFADLACPELRAIAFEIMNAVTLRAILPASVVAGRLGDRVGQTASARPLPSGSAPRAPSAGSSCSPSCVRRGADVGPGGSPCGFGTEGTVGRRRARNTIHA
jgi:hypothetical protein